VESFPSRSWSVGRTEQKTPSSSKNAWTSSKALGYEKRTRWLCAILTRLQKKVGTIPKDTSAGPFADEWRAAFGEASKDVEEVDISPALSSAALSVKDENELVRFLENDGSSFVELIQLSD
jgi:nucleosome binding factor SPN SPT16 subunit